MNIKQPNNIVTIFFISIILPIIMGCVSRQSPSSSDENDPEIWGIDISRHQCNVNWDKVLASDDKPSFVFLKATEGTLIVDPTYQQHLKELREKGVLCGAYHFFGHRTSGKEQAKNFIKNAKLQKDDLQPVLDIEQHRFFKDPKKMVVEVRAFCDEIRKYYGIYPILYCSSGFYRKYLEADFPADEYVLWIADYTKEPNYEWHFWQHTPCHHIPGISGDVDRNIFAGSKSDLKKLKLR